ncbi:MAG TPA: Stp1/IreP family PP2C-type Ser/Thr phosphatase [Noviherbaspirillum sp.]
MVPHPAFEFAAKTDTGLIRSHNEDSIAINPDYGFAILADGMGGYNAGEVASDIATSVLKDALEDGLKQLQSKHELRAHCDKQIHQLMIDSIQRANTAILHAADAEPEYAGMGTTLVAALFHEGKVTVAHVGDSRAYRLRQGTLEQITHDHSLLQEQIDAGLIAPEWARFSLNKNLVTRAVGVGFDMEVEIHDHDTEPGDVYLLCSDGLSDMLDVREIQGILKDCGAALEEACDTLVQRANDNGGRDNISVILIRIPANSGASGNLFGRIMNWLT